MRYFFLEEEHDVPLEFLPNRRETNIKVTCCTELCRVTKVCHKAPKTKRKKYEVIKHLDIFSSPKSSKTFLGPIRSLTLTNIQIGR